MSQLRTLQFYGTTSIGFNILDRSQFKLHTFESDSEDREAVFRFLYTQDELIDLTLWLPEAPQSNLSPRFLPDLTALGAGAHDISRIIPGRPISHLSVWEDPIPCLSSLKYSARPIKVLQLWNISTADMELIALELPCLEVLWAGYQVCDSNVSIWERRFTNMVLIYLITGNGRFHIGPLQITCATNLGTLLPTWHLSEPPPQR
jgi:hypothetical protein